MIGRNITNHSLEKKKEPWFDLFGGKTFFPMFHFENLFFIIFN